MDFLPEEIAAFRDRYTEAFGEPLTEDAALDMMDRLAELYRIILKRPPSDPLSDSALH